MRDLIGEGDRLTSIVAPGSISYVAGRKNVMSIGVRKLPGPMGYYLVANVIFEDDQPDIIIPLHGAEEFRVSNPDG
ncbi:hypothetical protein [Mycobacterium persicum]|uniref:hypothetical protein n=1 Tax=Mycobacterium persicum TaxID=1487726 RepID=UPI0015942BFF|nr:hypothetical protein [Mycobacterium persicum]